MNWHSLDEFLAMGGYGAYVWGAFGLTALVIVIEIWQLRRQRRDAWLALAKEEVDDETAA